MFGKVNAPWKINMTPKNGGLQADFPFQFRYSKFHVNFRGCANQYITCMSLIFRIPGFIKKFKLRDPQIFGGEYL